MTVLHVSSGMHRVPVEFMRLTENSLISLTINYLLLLLLLLFLIVYSLSVRDHFNNNADAKDLLKRACEGIINSYCA